MKLGWLYTDKYGNVNFYEKRSDGFCSGTWVRIAYFVVEGADD